jgi:hypothetical protein
MRWLCWDNRYATPCFHQLGHFKGFFFDLEVNVIHRISDSYQNNA